MSLLRNSPWFAALFGAGLVAFALYVLVTGEIQIDKKATLVATRADDPGMYWIAWLVLAALAALVSRHAWRLLRGER